MSESRLNGATKWIIGILIGAITGALAAGTYLGSEKQVLRNHILATSLHETPTQKQERIDDRIRLYLAPLTIRQDETNRRLQEIENRLIKMEKN